MTDQLPQPPTLDIKIRMQDGLEHVFNFNHDNTTVRTFAGHCAVMNHVMYLRPNIERPLAMYGYSGLPELLRDAGMPTLHKDEPSTNDVKLYMAYIRASNKEDL